MRVNESYLRVGGQTLARYSQLSSSFDRALSLVKMNEIF